MFQEAEAESSPEGTTPKKAFPKLAADVAAIFKLELAEMRRILDAQAVRLPPDRFDDTNAELLRFASACGLLQVTLMQQICHLRCKGRRAEQPFSGILPGD